MEKYNFFYGPYTKSDQNMPRELVTIRNKIERMRSYYIDFEKDSIKKQSLWQTFVNYITGSRYDYLHLKRMLNRLD